MAIRIGTLRHRVKLQQRSTAQDASGGQVTTWSDVATVWADIQPLSGRELLAAQAVNSEVSHQIVIRWQPAFATPKSVAALRILYGSRIFNIAAALNEDERNRTLTLQATEGLNDG